MLCSPSRPPPPPPQPPVSGQKTAEQKRSTLGAVLHRSACVFPQHPQYRASAPEAVQIDALPNSFESNVVHNNRNPCQPRHTSHGRSHVTSLMQWPETQHATFAGAGSTRDCPPHCMPTTQRSDTVPHEGTAMLCGAQPSTQQWVHQNLTLPYGMHVLLQPHHTSTAHTFRPLTQPHPAPFVDFQPPRAAACSPLLMKPPRPSHPP